MSDRAALRGKRHRSLLHIWGHRSLARLASRLLGAASPFCLFEVGRLATLGRPVVAEVVDLDVLPGLVAGVAAELVVIGPHRARIVVVASDDEGIFWANYGCYFGKEQKEG